MLDSEGWNEKSTGRGNFTYFFDFILIHLKQWRSAPIYNNLIVLTCHVVTGIKSRKKNVGTCNMHWGRERCVQNFGGKISKQENILGHIGIIWGCHSLRETECKGGNQITLPEDSLSLSCNILWRRWWIFDSAKYGDLWNSLATIKLSRTTICLL